MDFQFLLMTNDPHLAGEAEKAGVERIGPDLEILGKQARQKNRDARISGHTIEDVRRIRKALIRSELFVRINPIQEHSEEEIERVLQEGARVVMLPMFRTAAEVALFVSLVRGRAKTLLLLETPEAMMRVDEILAVEGIHGGTRWPQ